MPQGQYEFNFTFELPKSAPSSFKFITAKGEQYSVTYTIYVYFNDPQPLMVQFTEIRVLGLEQRKSSTRVSTGRKHKSIDKIYFKDSLTIAQLDYSNAKMAADLYEQQSDEVK